MTKNQPALSALFRSRTGRTTHAIRGITPDDLQGTAIRLGYWPDRTNRFKGW